MALVSHLLSWFPLTLWNATEASEEGLVLFLVEVPSCLGHYDIIIQERASNCHTPS